MDQAPAFITALARIKELFDLEVVRVVERVERELNSQMGILSRYAEASRYSDVATPRRCSSCHRWIEWHVGDMFKCECRGVICKGCVEREGRCETCNGEFRLRW